MTGKKGMVGGGGKRDGAGRPSLKQEFVNQVEAVKNADAGCGLGSATEVEFQTELKKMRQLQRRIEKRLAEAQAIVAELEPIVGNSDWRQMSGWCKRYAASNKPLAAD